MENTAAVGAKVVEKVETIVRFDARQRIEHIILMTTFIVLSLTGLVQRYYDVGISQWIITQLGGIDGTRLIHRIFGFLLAVGISYHFAILDYGLFTRTIKLSMMPTLKDARDVVDELKRGLGIKTGPPQYGRYDYRQKFEYLGLVFGSVILILTGFILIFPVDVSQWFSGQVVAAALEFHGNEATLAIIVILIWHFYDVMFKPGIFPVDTSIWTGKISRKRMEEEHSLEYAAIQEGEKAAEVKPVEGE